MSKLFSAIKISLTDDIWDMLEVMFTAELNSLYLVLNGELRGMNVLELLPCIEPETISDGFHTFAELYTSRSILTAAFFNMLHASGVVTCKSWKHSDGEACFWGGWFVVFAQLPTGQISFHYPEKDWAYFNIPEMQIGFVWDGHKTPDVHERILSFFEKKS